jgi:Chlamydia major outer membrane protein
MKKIYALFTALLTYSAVYALPVYNPDQPELLKYGVFTCEDSCWGLEFGYRGDFVFDRKLKKRNEGNLFDYHRQVCDYQSSINAGQLTLNVCDRLDIYGWVGASQTEFETQVRFLLPVILQPTPFFNIRGRTKEEFAWGVGARAILWTCGRTAIGVDGQYAQTHSQFQCLSLDGIPIQNFLNPALQFLDPSRFSLRHREWQISFGISHRICWLVPYAAVKYSNISSNIRGPNIFPQGVTTDTFSSRLKFRNKDYVGFVVGVSLVDSERMHVTAEGRFVDEKALTVAADIRF